MSYKNGQCVGIFSNTFWSIYNFRRSLVKVLLNEGYRVIAISANDQYKSLVADLGCEVVVIKNFDAQSTAVFKEAALIREVIYTIKALPCEYIYTFTIKPNLYTALTSSLTGKKVILTVNGLGNVFSEGNYISKISLQLFKRAFKRAYRVVFQNHDDYAFFRDKINLDQNKVSFVRGSGVNTKEFNFSPKVPSPGNCLIFLLACRLLKEKGVYEYIEAARRIKAEYKNVQFWLVGMEAKNPSAISIDELQQYNREGIIKLLPPTDDINSLLEKADVMVLPSYYKEGIPRILLEGLSKGLPIITTDSVGCRETVINNGNGYMIEPRSSDTLEKAICKMILLPVEERERMRVESRKLAETEFDECTVIENYINIINQPLPVTGNFKPKALGTQ
ncbi:MAG TPA: glycosyltransferase family 4 protein [Chitinophagaceae bacterium]|jgi:glycosyltransferase involved in cell wall biosynthesis|nr:glycosyltransferase family 4 protein [Chitinophagaceae bacterium]